ncbi:IS66 family insertion sequence element accessory protein TnpA [Vibrio cholerae]|uniref:IS66 family insertion sequence element accessory protein TnpA n=1 Tax=Vibrio cholerae TaxID=666 RepID=UPI001D36775B|nr:helix-turn-helix domain-containing protein [Vibrio cholerae]EGR1041693.1 helix-turn-helix domain-containing protein [Vibrio cholerae]HDL9454362.1 helix-turn-helix domain-containing protein [Vibrio cholerae]HDZ9478213.1 helix-turn-helix domain-containing protein [Vibrio cholerae]
MSRFVSTRDGRVREQQKQSQLTIKQFCEYNSINYQTFFYWSKRLRSPETVQTLQPIEFDEPRHSLSESVVLLFANGIRAELPAALTPAQIKHWIDALQ